MYKKLKYYNKNRKTIGDFAMARIGHHTTVIDSTNQILIPGAGIMERRHQWNVYRLPRVPLASLTESHSSLAEFFSDLAGSLFAGYYPADKC